MAKNHGTTVLDEELSLKSLESFLKGNKQSLMVYKGDDTDSNALTSNFRLDDLEIEKVR